MLVLSSHCFCEGWCQNSWQPLATDTWNSKLIFGSHCHQAEWWNQGQKEPLGSPQRPLSTLPGSPGRPGPKCLPCTGCWHMRTCLPLLLSNEGEHRSPRVGGPSAPSTGLSLKSRNPSSWQPWPGSALKGWILSPNSLAISLLLGVRTQTFPVASPFLPVAPILMSRETLVSPSLE